MRFIIPLALLFSLLTTALKAEELPIPRFVSLRSDMVYMRAGPGERFPIEWVYKRKNFPVKIIDSFEYWYKVEDVNQTQGWIHKRMLAGLRTALTPSEEKTPLYRKKDTGSKILAFFDGQSIVQLLQCKAGEAFCQVKYNDLKGYILRDSLYGLLPNEDVDE